MPPRRAGTNLTKQLQRLRGPASVMLITEDKDRPLQRVGDVNLEVYTRSEIRQMDERLFTTLVRRHNCILLAPQLGDGELFLRSPREALNN
ncbi:TPA: hypothetical protein HA344_05280 [Candidatus Bathyarchaeota archaeon]|nr:hypothetical protein [Candidatus Bathyarchaeota archaeon]